MNYDHLYIHIPFCANKCSYCAFYSEPQNSEELKQQFLRKIEEDLQKNYQKLQNIKTIFIGGGTPTELNADELEKLFNSIKKLSNTETVIEWTMESNPQTLTDDRIKVMQMAGVNRISIGVQSFNAEMRKTIGRTANPDSIGETINKLNSVGINNINLDLIYGIPGQTSEMWVNDLKKAVSLPISHISAYSLSIEEDSVLAQNRMEVDDELASDMQERAIDLLSENGFDRYEISNYAKNNQKCLHNYGIWHGETYLGLGPSAASFDGEKRVHQPNSLKSWLNYQSPEEDIISNKSRAKELFVIGLRTIDGWDIQEFETKTGFKLHELYKNELELLINQGFLKQTTTTISPTKIGLLYADHIAVKLI